MPIFVTFKLLHLDFSYWPICQWPNQCGLLHNELLIFLIPLPKAAKIYQNAISSFFPPVFLSCPGADGRRNIVGTEHGRRPWGTVVAWSVSAWSLAQPVNRLWSGSAMYNSIMQPFHGQRTPTVLIQTPPKGQTQTKRSAEAEVFILSNCPFNLKRICVILRYNKNWPSIKQKHKCECVYLYRSRSE